MAALTQTQSTVSRRSVGGMSRTDFDSKASFSTAVDGDGTEDTGSGGYDTAHSHETMEDLSIKTEGFEESCDNCDKEKQDIKKRDRIIIGLIILMLLLLGTDGALLALMMGGCGTTKEPGPEFCVVEYPAGVVPMERDENDTLAGKWKMMNNSEIRLDSGAELWFECAYSYVSDFTSSQIKCEAGGKQTGNLTAMKCKKHTCPVVGAANAHYVIHYTNGTVLSKEETKKSTEHILEVGDFASYTCNDGYLASVGGAEFTQTCKKGVVLAKEHLMPTCSKGKLGDSCTTQTDCKFAMGKCETKNCCVNNRCEDVKSCKAGWQKYGTIGLCYRRLPKLSVVGAKKAASQCTQNGGGAWAMPRNETQNNAVKQAAGGTSVWLGVFYNLQGRRQYSWADHVPWKTNQWTNWPATGPYSTPGQCNIMFPDGKWKSAHCQFGRFDVVCQEELDAQQ